MRKNSRNDSRRRGYHERKVDTRELRHKFLIVCEGTESEPNYFDDLRIDLRVQATVNVVGTGFNTKTLVQRAIELRNRGGKGIYNEVWCVFDLDDFSHDDFNGAIELAKQNGLHPAYSNESFELWYLLHFCYYTAASGRSEYFQKLGKWLEEKYEKSSRRHYDKLKDKLPAAIRNAERLMARVKFPNNPARCKPSTTVHLLVKSLQRHSPSRSGG